VGAARRHDPPAGRVSAKSRPDRRRTARATTRKAGKRAQPAPARRPAAQDRRAAHHFRRTPPRRVPEHAHHRAARGARGDDRGLPARRRPRRRLSLRRTSRLRLTFGERSPVRDVSVPPTDVMDGVIGVAMDGAMGGITHDVVDGITDGAMGGITDGVLAGVSSRRTMARPRPTPRAGLSRVPGCVAQRPSRGVTTHQARRRARSSTIQLRGW
jgi:hypothetical protein